MARNATAHEVSPADFPNKVGVALPAGAYYFMYAWKNGVRTDEAVGFIHGCPCGCGCRSAMWFEGHENAGGPKWSVTGEWPKVTMMPSIGIACDKKTGKFHWHGYLENGVFIER